VTSGRIAKTRSSEQEGGTSKRINLIAWTARTTVRTLHTKKSEK
jgi:hypothetical protein